MSDKNDQMHTALNDEVRGDTLYVSCRKRPPSSWEKFRRSVNHHAFGITIKMDARARVLKKYTSTTSEADNSSTAPTT